jgi:hypothetical protein
MEWGRLPGVLFLLIFSIWNIVSHRAEQNDRRRVLVGGTVARGVARRSTAVEEVSVEWVDSAGRHRHAWAWTGKPFARHLREDGKDLAVDIKYVDDPAVDPVILSEAAERERVNQWWIRADSLMAAIASILLMQGAFNALRSWRRRNASFGE